MRGRVVIKGIYRPRDRQNVTRTNTEGNSGQEDDV